MKLKAGTTQDPTDIWPSDCQIAVRVEVNSDMVRERGLEPPRLAAQPPQGCASTSSATRARQSLSYLFLGKNSSFITS